MTGKYFLIQQDSVEVRGYSMPAAHSLPSAFQRAFEFDQFTAAVAPESESEPVLFVAKYHSDSPRLELRTARLASIHKEETP